MQIDKISVALRPRTAWEAIDLGFGMARVWWAPIFKSWLLVALPVFLILSAALYQYPLIASIIFWWLKPAYEQLPLMYLSRALFQQPPSMRELISEHRTRIFRQLFANVIWRRLSLIRSFTAPVAQLENLSGKQRHDRIQVLTLDYKGAGWLTVVGVHIETIMYFSIIALIWFCIPEQVEVEIWFDEHLLLVEFGSNVAYFIGAAIMAPFYVSSGFSLYLNRRAQLEGWDIELEFRQLQNRLSKHRPRASGFAASIFALLAAFSLLVPEVNAEEQALQSEHRPPVVSATKAKNLITEVLADDDFGEIEKISNWKYIGEIDDTENKPLDFNSNFLLLLAQMGEILLWVFVAILIILVLYNLPRWKQSVKWGTSRSPRIEPPPKILFGLDITEESLPDNIAEEALRMFQENKIRESLSLLYRGSLAALVNKYGVSLKESDTEGECAARVVNSDIENVADFFNDLTQIWIQLAYGHREPPAEKVESLCSHWNTHFGATQ